MKTRILRAMIGVLGPGAFLLLTLTACGPSPVQSDLKRSDPVIMALGDSITLGVGSQDGGYPARLQTLLDGAGLRARVINRGISGEKAHQTRTRLGAELKQADIVLLMVGFNDLTRPDECPRPLGCRTLACIEAMIDWTRKRNKSVLLGTVTPAEPGNIRDWANAEINRFNGDLARLAERKGIILVDTHGALWAALDKRVFADHAHPNGLGYDLLARCWLKALQRGAYL